MVLDFEVKNKKKKLKFFQHRNNGNITFFRSFFFGAGNLVLIQFQVAVDFSTIVVNMDSCACAFVNMASR